MKLAKNIIPLGFIRNIICDSDQLSYLKNENYSVKRKYKKI